MNFSFKSVGKKISSKKFKVDNEDAKSKIIPIGIKTPVEFGNKKTKLFKMHEDPMLQLKDNLKNLIQTNYGERLGKYEFGCNLKSLLFERVSLDENFQKEASDQVVKQVEKYIPAIQIDNITFSVNKKNRLNNNMLAEVKINIDFSIPSARIKNQRLETTLFCGG